MKPRSLTARSRGHCEDLTSLATIIVPLKLRDCTIFADTHEHSASFSGPTVLKRRRHFKQINVLTCLLTYLND